MDGCGGAPHRRSKSATMPPGNDGRRHGRHYPSFVRISGRSWTRLLVSAATLFGALSLVTMLGFGGMPGTLVLASVAVLLLLIEKATHSAVVDEVLDEGDHLVFRDGDIAQRIRLRDIEGVRLVLWNRPGRVVVHTTVDGPLGREIAFMPPLAMNPLNVGAIADELNRRARTARLRFRSSQLAARTH